MHSVNHFLDEHFPNLDHPAYQTPAEKITFVTVATMLAGLLAAALTFFFLRA